MTYTPTVPDSQAYACLSTTKVGPHAGVIDASASLMRDSIDEFLWHAEMDLSSTRNCLAGEDDVGAKHHLKRLAAAVRAAAQTFNQMDALQNGGSAE